MNTMNARSLRPTKAATLIDAIQRMSESRQLCPPDSDMHAHISGQIDRCRNELGLRLDRFYCGRPADPVANERVTPEWINVARELLRS